MTPEEYERLSNDTVLAGQVGQYQNTATSTQAQQYYVEDKERSIVEAQLEVNQTLVYCHHLLKQDVWAEKEDKTFDWIKIQDQSKRTLTDEGVEKIIQFMRFYINKENLLSNFDEKQINRIMLTFCLSLNGNFFMTYQKLFRQPTFEECKKILQERIQDKVNIKKFTREILGQKANDKEIEADILWELEDRIEKEIFKIKEEKRKENLREWEMLFHQLEQLVFATLNRAWKGEERGSLRRHTNIAEVWGRTTPQTPKADDKWKLFGG